MCNSKLKTSSHVEGLAELNGRAVLQPPSNRLVPSEPAKKKKTLHKSLSMPTSLLTTPHHQSHVSSDSAISPRATPPLSPTTKTGNCEGIERPAMPKMLPRCSSMRVPGSIAAAQREQAMLDLKQRKSRIERYGRTPAKLQALPLPLRSAPHSAQDQDKRCGFITPNSDPLYVAYHDEEWGVAVHDDKMLFELLVLAGAQVGLDWTTILKKRNDFRTAFAGFDAEVVSKFTERQKASICAEYGLDLGRVRGIVDNANRILEVRRDFGSLNNYIWGFVNHKPITPNYKSSRKIPVKTSKSESISKDMVRRGFRFVGPTVVHTFMQAAGLTIDHIVTCPRNQHCLISI